MSDLKTLEQNLLNEGKLIEAGFVGLRIAAIPTDAPSVQLEEMRNAFFAGAQHLFSSIMRVLDPGNEPTEADLRCMEQIDDELRAFINDFSCLRLPAAGRA